MAQQWTQRLGREGTPRTHWWWTIRVPLSEDDVRRLRRWLRITGALGILGGAAAIAVPAVASVATTIFIGWILVYAGVVALVHAFSMRGRPRGGLRMFNAALTLLLGLCLVIFPRSGTLTLTLLLAAWFFASGALLLLSATRRSGRPGAGLTAFNAALSLLLGILIVADLPSSAGWAIGLLVGINLVFWGVRTLLAAGHIESMPDV
jgi:uncharacterized membrane protein HdeD (DUF308 family)